MNIKLEDLKREIPYKWRIQSTFGNWGTCVAYIDSRDVQNILDEVCGPENWADKYSEVKGSLYCSIGIRINGEWTWKGDCGSESNVEKQKGEASDAFKRAGVKWGIGRFLYDVDTFRIPVKKFENSDKPKPYYKGQDGQDQQLYGGDQLTKYIISQRPQAQKPPTLRQYFKMLEKIRGGDTSVFESAQLHFEMPEYALAGLEEEIQKLNQQEAA